MEETKIPCFIYSKEVLTPLKKRKFEDYYIDAYNRAVELCNERYAEWIKEYKETYGLYNESLFNKFIRDKRISLYLRVNDALQYPVSMWTNSDGDTIGFFIYKGERIYMLMELKDPTTK